MTIGRSSSRTGSALMGQLHFCNTSCSSLQDRGRPQWERLRYGNSAAPRRRQEQPQDMTNGRQLQHPKENVSFAIDPSWFQIHSSTVHMFDRRKPSETSTSSLCPLLRSWCWQERNDAEESDFVFEPLSRGIPLRRSKLSAHSHNRCTL